MSTSILDHLKYLIREQMSHHVGSVVVDDDTLLFEGGLELDSFCVVELIVLTEDHFGVQYREEDLKDEYFRTPSALAGLLRQIGAR